jgi:hypothetical protein
MGILGIKSLEQEVRMASKIGRPVVNKHNVPKRQWEAWSNPARKVFNTMYHSLRPSLQFAFIHPDAPPHSKKHWETTRWNVAWESAQAVDGHGPIKQVVAVDA